MTVGTLATGPAVPLDAWARWWSAVERWVRTHRVLVGRVRFARVVLSWLGLIAVVVVLVARPEVREGAEAYLSVYHLLIVWFVLARPRTLSWRFVSSWFAANRVADWETLIRRMYR